MLVQKRNGYLVFLFILVFLSIGFAGCGDKADNPAPTGKTSSPQDEPMQKKAPEKATAVATDWRTIGFEKFTLSLPKDWNGDSDTNIWWPGEGSLDMGRPKVSLHCGATPIMPGDTVEGRLKILMGVDPINKTSVTVCGLKGFTCESEFNLKKHIGIYLEEKVGGEMRMLYFADCQAPAESYETHLETFKKIIDSMGCNN